MVKTDDFFFQMAISDAGAYGKNKKLTKKFIYYLTYSYVILNENNSNYYLCMIITKTILPI